MTLECRPFGGSPPHGRSLPFPPALEFEMSHASRLMCATALAVAIPTGAHAYQVGVPDTYADLLWRVSSNVPGLSGCNELQVDATGDLVTSTKLSIYGALNCPFQQGGSYGVTGSGVLQLGRQLHDDAGGRCQHVASMRPDVQRPEWHLHVLRHLRQESGVGRAHLPLAPPTLWRTSWPRCPATRCGLPLPAAPRWRAGRCCQRCPRWQRQHRRPSRLP